MDAKFGFVSKKYPNPENFIRIGEIRYPTSLGLALESVISDIDMDEKFGFVSKNYPNPEIFVDLDEICEINRDCLGEYQ